MKIQKQRPCLRVCLLIASAMMALVSLWASSSLSLGIASGIPNDVAYWALALPPADGDSVTCLSTNQAKNTSLVYRYWKSGNISIKAIVDHVRQKALQRDECIYALGYHHNTISMKRKSHNSFPADLEKNRRRNIEAFWFDVLQFLQSYHGRNQLTNYYNDHASHRWCHLRRALFGNKTDTTTPKSIPIRFRYTDYNGCDDRPSSASLPVPTFSNSRPTNCQHGLVLPNYSMIKFAQSTPLRAQWSLFYRTLRYGRWRRKVPKAVWRGTITGDSKTVDNNVRWKLCTLATREPLRELLDVKPTAIQTSNYKLLQRTGALNTTNVPTQNLRQYRMPMEDFQLFQAVIDIDGNSWSSRFPNLLCLRTIVLKVEPEYVDSLYGEHLEAWKHYIPVSRSLDDLEEQLQWILDPQNYPRIQEMLSATHEWCVQHFVQQPALVHDILDIWNDYVQLLERGDSDWQAHWNNVANADDSGQNSISWEILRQEKK